MNDAEQLEGQVLIAMPSIGDPRFERTVIFLCAHSSEGAMGLVVNRPADDLTFVDLLDRLSILPEEDQIRISDDVANMHVQFGGPVETGRGFVLHTTDYFIDDSTLPIDDKIGLTATLDILRAIAEGDGPRRAMLALGYAGWGPGQLESELQLNGWLNCEADEKLLFGSDLESRYDYALKKIGIDISMLSSEAGHA